MKRGVDYIGVGVGAVIVDSQGRLFLARRGPKAKNERGLWEFPGGSVEFGERLAEALQREMKEEYGIEIAVGDLPRGTGRTAGRGRPHPLGGRSALGFAHLHLHGGFRPGQHP